MLETVLTGSVDCSSRGGGCNNKETAGDKLREGNYGVLQFIKHGCSPQENDYTAICQ